MEWLECPSIGNFGGLVCIWRKGIFEVNKSLIGDGFLVIQGFWEK